MWSELFVDGAPQLPQFGAPGVSWEATVYGNRVDDCYTVGLVYITQSSVRIIQGFINAIDLGTGEFWVAGNSATPGTGIKARLNDPVGKLASAICKYSAPLIMYSKCYNRTVWS